MPSASALGHRRVRVLQLARRRSPRARRGASSRRARCRAGSRSRPPSRRCRPRGARPPPAPAARCRDRPPAPTRRTRRRPRRRRRRAPSRGRARAALPRRAAATGPYQRSQASRRWLTRRAPMRVTRTSLPGGAVVATSKRCRARRLAEAPRSSAARSTPGRQVEVSTVGQREHGEQRERRVDRDQQREGDAEAQDPAAGGEQRHVHVVEHEHLVAQHRQAVEVVPGARGARSWPPTPAAAPRATRARSSAGRGSGAGCGR